MIAELVKNNLNPANPIIRPISMTGDDLYDLLNAAFPYTHETYDREFWAFFPCCAGGYDNAIEFRYSSFLPM